MVRRALLDVQTDGPSRVGVGRGIICALGESENGEKCVIDGPQLVCRQISDLVAKSLDVNGSELFDKDVGRVAGNGYLGSKRGGSGAT